MKLKGKKIAVFAADGYEDLEAWYPILRMREAGAEVIVVGTDQGPEKCTSKHGYPLKIDHKAGEVNPDELDGAIVPGGWAPDRLRRCQNTLKIIKKLDEAGKMIAAICHGGWVLISADVVQGKTMTSTPAIKDDLINAGANWVNEEVQVDGNLVSSRAPGDLPAFCSEIIGLL